MVAFAGLMAIVIGAFIWRSSITNEAERASQRQDYALCTIVNDGRKATRQNSVILYGLVADVLRLGGTGDPKLRQAFQTRLAALRAQVKVLRPIDCRTYVRPDLPPDQG